MPELIPARTPDSVLEEGGQVELGGGVTLLRRLPVQLRRFAFVPRHSPPVLIANAQVEETVFVLKRKSANYCKSR